MIQIQPIEIEQQRFLAISTYLPKCTLRMMVNLKIICFDTSFDLKQIEKKCNLPLISCKSCEFDQMIDEQCCEVSEKAKQCGIIETMSVKEAIRCVFLTKSTFENG